MGSAFTKKIAGSKASFGQNYGKEGRYWIIFNSGKMDRHSGSGVEQVIFEGSVIRIVDPGPPIGSRFKPSKGGNDAPHTPCDPFTFYYSASMTGSEGRCKRLLLVATNMTEAQLPAAILPATGQACAPGTPGAVDPIEFAIEQATSPSTNALKDIVIEVTGRGMRTQGRGPAGPQDIIAVDPVRRVWAREVHENWEGLHENVKQMLMRDKRLELMLQREERERSMVGAK